MKHALTVCTALAATATLASAQQTKLPAELGVDAGISVGFDNPRVTVISVPVPAIRFGVFVSDRVSIEPRIGFNSIHASDGSASSYNLETGVLLHFENQPVGRGLYARPFVGIVGFTSSGGSDTQTLFGAGLGIKESFAERFASRIEVNYSHMSAQSGGSASNSLGILFGVSVFSR